MVRAEKMSAVRPSAWVADSAYDVLIVGGGPAGLSAALTLARARRSVLILDNGAARNAPAAHVHGYLAREGVPPTELLAAGRAEVAAYGGHFATGTAVSAQRVSPWCWRVTLADERTVLARRLLVSTGLFDELPQIPGVAERWGRDVLHCPYCHGWEVRDQEIGVLATGPMSVHQALLFRQWSEHVTLLQHTGPTPTEEQWQQLAARGVAVVDGEIAALQVSDDQLTGVRLASGRVVPVQALVVSPRFTARADLLSSVGIEPVEQRAGDAVIGTAVPADATGATTVPGVWVAGNVTTLSAQVLPAAAAGQTTAVAINTDLIAEDTRDAVVAYRASRAACSTEFGPQHTHGRSCWWNALEARWECYPARPSATHPVADAPYHCALTQDADEKQPTSPARTP